MPVPKKEFTTKAPRQEGFTKKKLPAVFFVSASRLCALVDGFLAFGRAGHTILLACSLKLDLRQAGVEVF
jgi:hypothetical protein